MELLHVFSHRANTEKSTSSSGALEFLSIIVEDFMQLIVTIIVEGKFNPQNDNVLQSAVINLIFSILGILHKLAHTYDQRHDIRNKE